MTIQLDSEEIEALNLWLYTLCAEHIGPSGPLIAPDLRATWDAWDIRDAIATVSQELADAYVGCARSLSNAIWEELQQTKPHLIMVAMKCGAASYIGGST